MTRRRWLAPALLVAAVATLVFTSVGWPCPIRALAGVPCPGCGLTRATRHAIHGDAAAATAMHPLVWIVVPVVGAFVVVELAGFVRTGAWGASMRVRGARVVMLATAALMFVVWIARFFGAFGGPAV
ncbi:MAG: DUF2752 domain-containing protein [Labilithrix sp.]|nr:DUF2752 domain-containing protein [Labilithrix sp.]